MQGRARAAAWRAAGGATMCGVLLALLATTAALAWQPGVADAEAFARTRRGGVSFAVRTECGAWGRRQDAHVPSASVLKAMLLVAYVQRGAVRDRPLSAAQKALLSPMIRRSDNVAATKVFNAIGASTLQRDARRWGMRAFHVSAFPWGMSQVTARDQARFWLHIDRRLPARHRAYGLTLLRTIVPSQRWGIGQAKPRGWTLHFKGGWGSGTGAVDHQVALLTRGEERVGVAIMTTAQGTHAYGKATLRGMARRLLRGLAARTRVC